MNRADILTICIAVGLFIAAFALLRRKNPWAVLAGFSLLAAIFIASWVVGRPWNTRRAVELVVAAGVVLLWRAIGKRAR
jgi:hypothetical protein